MSDARLSAPLRASVVLTLLSGVVVTGIVFVSVRADAPPTSDDWSHSAVVAEAAPHVDMGVTEAFQKRVQTLEARVAQSPSDRGLRIELARLLHDGHRGGASVLHYRKAISLDPADAQAYYDLAAALTGEQMWDEALAVLEELLAVDPENAVAVYNLGAISASQRRSGEALRYWDLARTMTTDPDLLRLIDAGLAKIEEA